MIYKGTFPIIVEKFNKHKEIKEKLLNLLNNTNSEKLQSIDN